ncbi:endonuclease/exonuclease/phosphatase family protein [Caviibacter abscessus]|uniref:endonuclease/exonuclease/phosphatase family protein n=1 Tax=Caviibacter abscessus TaxID=1766719 RepID=UPI001E2DEED6|nr:endonuclease/exonuclease/phosphatase family protein [Caviibacter abscessus]
MKKIFIILLFSFITFSEKISIASFNIARLGESKKDYKALVKIIKKFDIIALEEVMNEDGIITLNEKLGKEYDYILSKAVGSKKYKEHYAIIYKKSKVNEIKNIGVYNDKKDDFIREPSAFYIKSNKFDFVLIPVHSIFGDDPKKRMIEASKYVEVYDYFLDKTNEEDIIILGDFNLPANDKAFLNLKKKNMVNIINPEKNKTTLSKKGLANSYDNMFLNLEKTKEFTNTFGVYDFTKNNYEDIRKYVSDHLLIFGIFENSEDIDEK